MHIAPTLIPAKPFDLSPTGTTLFGALLDASQQYGRAKPILEDVEGKPLSYANLILGALIIGSSLARVTARRDTVGVLLPNVNGLVVTLMGLNAFGRTVALLNFTAGIKNITAALQAAEITTLVTSRRFIEKSKLEDVIAALEVAARDRASHLRIVYLEDVRASLSVLDKVAGVMRAAFARRVHAQYATTPDEPAVILFTSGTEGVPKGVALSNRNLLANAYQTAIHAGDALRSSDIVMNPLPMFHSFGLTAAALMPIYRGMKTVLYPSPLHYRQVAATIASSQASVLLATDTFLQGYARAANKGDLASLRLVVCGAERVKETTRALWSQWPAEILEGYGATECSPIISCNLPSNNRPGTVGELLPGIEARLEPVHGINEGGRLMVRGPNVMLGYVRVDSPGIIEPPQWGWHDTGDIVAMDERGLISIRGRAKRFAKIGGEMISLAAVELMVAGLWPQGNHVVVALPDDRKGEQLVLVTDFAGADKGALQNWAKREGYTDLWVPRAISVVPQIPVLGSGKVDLPAALALARQSRPEP